MNPQASPCFLVIDHNADSRELLMRALARKFPSAVLHEHGDGMAALAMAASDDLTAIVAHRTVEFDAETLVALLRHTNRRVPIVMVSGANRPDRARLAGADAFLHYDRWLMTGTVVAEAIAEKAAAAVAPPPRSDDRIAEGELEARG